MQKNVAFQLAIGHQENIAGPSYKIVKQQVASRYSDFTLKKSCNTGSSDWIMQYYPYLYVSFFYKKIIGEIDILVHNYNLLTHQTLVEEFIASNLESCTGSKVVTIIAIFCLS